MTAIVLSKVLRDMLNSFIFCICTGDSRDKVFLILVECLFEVVQPSSLGGISCSFDSQQTAGCLIYVRSSSVT